MKKDLRIIFIALTFLASVSVISTVSVVISDKAKSADTGEKLTKDTEDALTRLRSLMTGATLGIEPLIAYIIPSDDAHQVIKINCATILQITNNEYFYV